MFDFVTSLQKLVRASGGFLPSEEITEISPTEVYNSTVGMNSLREIGFLHGSRIATEHGWQTVENVLPGEQVLTFDYGPQTVLENKVIEIRRDTIPDRKARLIAIPSGALGNKQDVRVLPMQEVLIESDEAEELYGDPFVLIPAVMLEGYKGIHKVPLAGNLSLSMLIFEREQVVHSTGGLLSLATTQGAFSPLSATAENAQSRYTRLSTAELLDLMKLMGCKAPCATFDAQSIDETYAAIEARLA
ncbi:MAG: Hint domain-containing protein [Roseinatronobacter sp.]